MGNINQNLIDSVIDTLDMTAVMTNINNLKTYLPENGTVTLTDEQRSSLLSMDVDNRVMVEETLEVMNQTGSTVLPAFLTPAALENDYTLYTQLSSIEQALNGVLQAVQDQRRLAAHEAYTTSLAVYGVYKVGAKNGFPGAQVGYDKLKQRFEGQGRGGVQQENPAD